MRIKLSFYFIWVLTDCINNAAGLGFSGFDAMGNAVWDLTSNVNIVEFETAMNPRNSASSWNTTTAKWLRRSATLSPSLPLLPSLSSHRVCYERVTWQRTHMTFLLSAFWHGFYPSYYLAFVYLSFLVEASKKVPLSLS